MRCSLCPSEIPAVPVKPAVEVRPAEPAHQTTQQTVSAAAVTAVAEGTTVGLKGESNAPMPDWVQSRVDRNDPDLIVTKSADGSIERIQIKVCSICRNSLKVCASYSVCVTPSEGKTTIWDMRGERTNVKDALTANAAHARKAWEENQTTDALKRVTPSTGNTVTPVASGFEGFGIIASRAVSRGFIVHPLYPSRKNPILKEWQRLATADTEQIAQWAKEYPQANCGAVAKSEAHVFLDEDDVSRLHALYKERTGEEYPRSYATESRPRHRQSAWLQTEKSRTLGNIVQADILDKMISVRQNNEFVLVAGSIHPDTKLPYRVVDDSPIVPMPDTLADFILYLKKERVEQKKHERAEKKPTEHLPSWATADGDEEYEASPTLEGDRIYAQGERNDSVSKFAYRRWVQEICSEEELRRDVSAFNQTHCSPPLPDNEIEALINGKLSLKQIGSGLIFNGVVRPTNARVGLHGVPLPEPLEGDTVEEQMEDAVEKQDANPDVETERPNWNLLMKRSALLKPGPSWIDQHVQTASQLSCEPVKWVIHEMTLEGGVNLLCAEHGSYKSVLSLLMAKAMLTDSGFAGRKTLGKKLRVVYCDRENPEAVVMERLIGMGLVDADGKEIPGFHIWGGWPGAEFEPPEVMDDARLIEDATRHPETFYFFDSLSGFIQGMDENDNPKMHGYMSRATKLSRLCAGVQILHHTPKKGREYWRGAASIIDKSDHATYMEKKSECTVEMGAIRFRACGGWKNRLGVSFSQSFPDGRLGLYITYSTVKSGIASGSSGVLLGDAEGTTDAEAEIDFTKSDADLITEAKGHIEEAHRDGQVLNQSQLASLLGIDSAKVKARVLCATSPKSPRPWQARAGTRGNSLDFYPQGVKVPTAAEKTEKRRRKEAERIRTKRTGTLG